MNAAYSDGRRHLVALLAVVVTALYPLFTIAHFFLPLTIVGKNAYTMIPPVVFGVGALVFCTSDLAGGVLQGRAFGAAVALAIVAACIGAVRALAYGEPVDVLYFRYLILLFTFGLVAANIVRDSRWRERFGVVIICSVCIQALIGILHSHYFPMINIVEDAAGAMMLSYDSEHSREAGTLINPSVFAAVQLSGLCLLTFYPFRSRLLSNTWTRTALFGGVAYSLSLSGSRLPLIGAAVLAIALLARTTSSRGPGVPILLIIVGAVAVAFMAPNVRSHAVLRFDEGSGGRLGKLLLPLRLLSADVQAPLIGTTMADAAQAHTEDGTTISDNSYLLIAMNFGIPLMLAWVGLAIMFFSRWAARSLATKFMFALLLLYWALTNSILWDPWLCYYTFAFFCLAFSVGEAPPGRSRDAG